jgi:hypothetical protein
MNAKSTRTKEFNIIKNYILEQFKTYGIPLGHHDLKIVGTYQETIITLIALDDQYNYIKHINLKTFKDELEGKLSLKIIDTDITLTSISIKLEFPTEFILKEFKWICPEWLTRPLNFIRLHQQLRNHMLHDITDVQKVFDLLCARDNEFYDDIFLRNWESGNSQVIEYNSDEIINMLISGVKVSYDNLLSCQDTNIIQLLLNSIQLNDTTSNFKLIVHLVELKDITTISKLIKLHIEFIDDGILLKLVNSHWSEQLFQILISSACTIIPNNLVYSAIKMNNIYVIIYLLNNNIIKVDLEHLNYARDCNHYKIYELLRSRYEK